MSRELDTVPEDFSRAMAVVAHPDDLEYGAASAIARWTRAGRSVAYVIVTDGEAGIDAVPPAEGGTYPYEDLIRIHHAELRRAADHHRLVSAARAADPRPQPIGPLRELLGRIRAWRRDLEPGTTPCPSRST